MKLIVISASQPVEREHEIITELFELGLSVFHLRKPEMSTKDMRELIKKIPAHFRKRIVIHSHHKLAASLGLKGIHLTRAHRKRRYYQLLHLPLLRLRCPGLTISTSYNKLSHIYEDEGRFSYILLNPVFDPLTNAYHAGFSERSLKAAITKNPQVKIIARGGITIANIPKVAEAGFHGLALHSLIWKKGKPVEQFRNVLDALSDLGITPE